MDRWMYPTGEAYSMEFLNGYITTAESLARALRRLRDCLGRSGEKVRRADVAVQSSRLADYVYVGRGLGELVDLVNRVQSAQTLVEAKQAAGLFDQVVAAPGTRRLLGTEGFMDAAKDVADFAFAAGCQASALTSYNWGIGTAKEDNGEDNVETVE